MGIDAVIYAKNRDGAVPDLSWSLPNGVEWCALEDWDNAPAGATHSLANPWRYYAEDYPSGPGHQIIALLALLLESPDCEMVWYGGDCDGNYKPVTSGMLVEMLLVFLKEGACYAKYRRG